MAAGVALIWGFVTWQRHREKVGRDPLVHLSLARVPSVRSGLIGLFSQNLILMGVFFVIPLYLQLVLGLDALETGIKMLPVSITMFLTSAVGSRLSNRFAVRAIVRAGLLVTIAGALILLVTIRPTLSSAGFAVGMGVLGVGMGLMVSQLGNVVQSSVEDSGRSEAGGLQYTGQQLGSSLGVALIGAIVLMGLTSTFISNVEKDPRISTEIATQVGVAAGSNTNFVASDEVHAAATAAGLDPATASAIVEDYEAAQLRSLKAGLLAAALLALLSLAFTRELPHEKPEPTRKEPEPEPEPSGREGRASSGRHVGAPALRPQVLGTGRRHRHRTAGPGPIEPLDEAPVVGVLPHGEARARRPPRLHDLVVGARTGPQPFEEIEDQAVDGVGHRTYL